MDYLVLVMMCMGAALVGLFLGAGLHVLLSIALRPHVVRASPLFAVGGAVLGAWLAYSLWAQPGFFNNGGASPGNSVDDADRWYRR